HLVPEGEEEAGIAEERGDGDGKGGQEPLHAGWLVEHPFLQPRDRCQPLRTDRVPDAPAEGSTRAFAEVIAVPAIDRLQQQIDFDGFYLVETFRHTRHALASTSCSASGSTGLVRWKSSVASRERRRSSSWPYPVMATSRMPRISSRSRSRRATS